MIKLIVNYTENFSSINTKKSTIIEFNNIEDVKDENIYKYLYSKTRKFFSIIVNEIKQIV